MDIRNVHRSFALLFPEGGERTTMSDSPCFLPLFIAIATRPFSIVALYVAGLFALRIAHVRTATPLFNTRAPEEEEEEEVAEKSIKSASAGGRTLGVTASGARAHTHVRIPADATLLPLS